MYSFSMVTTIALGRPVHDGARWRPLLGLSLLPSPPDAEGLPRRDTARRGGHLDRRRLQRQPRPRRLGGDRDPERGRRAARALWRRADDHEQPDGADGGFG